MHGDPLPPISSQFEANPAVLNGDGRMAPPYVGHPTIAGKSLEMNEMPWDDPVAVDDEEGVVEPVFEADVFETEAALAALSANKQEEFPLDAFIIPEQAQRLPTGVQSAEPSANEHTPVTDLADRLEKLSHRLRVEESGAVLGRMAAGDRLDAMLAGLLGGYLASSK